MHTTRVKKKITVLELSKRTSIPLVRICAIERGRETPTSNEVEQITKILGKEIKFADKETVDAKKINFKEYFSAVNKATAEIKRRGFGKEQGGSGDMPCPRCEETLSFSVNAYNGHISAQCSTFDCLNFME